MKKVAKILGIAAIAFALFMNVNLEQNEKENTDMASVIALNTANATAAAAVKCRQTDVKTDYCWSDGAAKYYCANTTAKDNCTGKPKEVIIAQEMQ